MCTFKININIDINFKKLETKEIKIEKKNNRTQDIYIKNINDTIIFIFNLTLIDTMNH